MGGTTPAKGAPSHFDNEWLLFFFICSAHGGVMGVLPCVDLAMKASAKTLHPAIVFAWRRQCMH